MRLVAIRRALGRSTTNRVELVVWWKMSFSVMPEALKAEVKINVRHALETDAVYRLPKYQQ